jgi:hypothetical protein
LQGLVFHGPGAGHPWSCPLLTAWTGKFSDRQPLAFTPGRVDHRCRGAGGHCAGWLVRSFPPRHAAGTSTARPRLRRPHRRPRLKDRVLFAAMTQLGLTNATHGALSLRQIRMLRVGRGRRRHRGPRRSSRTPPRRGSPGLGLFEGPERSLGRQPGRARNHGVVRDGDPG